MLISFFILSYSSCEIKPRSNNSFFSFSSLIASSFVILLFTLILSDKLELLFLPQSGICTPFTLFTNICGDPFESLIKSYFILILLHPF